MPAIPVVVTVCLPMKLPSLRSVGIVGLTCLLILGIACWREWVAFDRKIGDTKTSITNLANSLARDAEATIEVADTIVDGVVVRLEHDGTTPAALAMLNEMLPSRIADVTRVSSIVVLGPHGDWLATSLPRMGGNLADRPAFEYARDHTDREHFISRPMLSRSTGRWIITVSRRFESHAGNFAGAVLATIEVAGFVSHYAEMDLGPNSVIALLTPTGTLLARYPWDVSLMGRDLSGAKVFSKLTYNRGGSYKTISIIDGLERFSGYRQSNRFPLVVVASVSVDHVLRGWLINAVIHLSMIVSVVAAVGLLGTYLVRQTARSQAAEAEVRNSEARLRVIAEKLEVASERAALAADSGAIGTWDWDVVNDTMVWDYWMYQHSGMEPRDELANYEMWMGRLHPDDRAGVERAMQESLLGTKPFDALFRIIWPDCSIHHVRGCGRATRDATGRATRMVGASWDVTGSRIEEEQREIIIEAAPNGMIIVDEGGLITVANSRAGQIFDYPNKQLVGQSVEVLVPETFGAANSAMRSALTPGQIDQGMSPERQITGRKRDGSPVTIEIRFSAVATPRGRIVVASLLDITERVSRAAARLEIETRERLAVEATNATLDRLSRHLEKARDQAERASQAKSRFLAGISHELRTPLNGILGYARLLQMEGGLSPSQAARVDAMLGAGEHLLEMISGVLDLSQIESEHLELQAVAVDVQAVAAACLDLVRPMAESKRLLLSRTVGFGTERQLTADPTRLRQILCNLLGNAVKFTDQGSVTMRLGGSADVLRIEVVDTGPGVAAEQRQRLFHDFTRLETETMSKVEGAGLGLALSARLASLMGGKLGYEHNPGGGSVFWLELPWGSAAAAAPPQTVLADLPPSPGAMRVLRVLVVDDMLMNQDISCSFLRAAGHQVTSVNGGLAAVEMVATTDFDVVLMDVRMPEVDGLEATRRIRLLPGPRGQVAIVALTAQAFADQIVACREAGMDSHLSKPFTPAALCEAVSSAAALRPVTDTVPRLAMPDAVSVVGMDLPVFDVAVFERTASFLASNAVAVHLQTISQRGETLLSGLQNPGSLASNELADAAHTLAGSGGMFGFKRLAALCGSFEQAIGSGAANTSALADSVIAAIGATQCVIRDRETIAAEGDGRQVKPAL